MKQLSFLLTLITFTVIHLNAQGNNNDPQQILDRASLKLRSAPAIIANFTLTQKDKYNHSGGSAKGLVKIKGNKYYLKEGDNEVFCNGVQTWNFDGGNEVTVAKTETADADDLSPKQILSGFNKNDFSFKLLSSSGTYHQVQLTPVDKRKNFKQIIIFINKSSNLITKAVISDKTDNLTEIAFSGINLNASIPDSQFTFDTAKHPGVEVINQ
jgi:outer membrane lipoprotein-sorting protein